MKYFDVNLLPLVINLIGTFILVEIFAFYYMIAIILCLGIDVLVTFTLSRFWVFQGNFSSPKTM
jgi:putative flippase GtrA